MERPGSFALGMVLEPRLGKEGPLLSKMETVPETVSSIVILTELTPWWCQIAGGTLHMFHLACTGFLNV